MDIDRVRYFLIFAETGSLVKASEVLHVSQPALSKALRLLETEVGMKLVQTEGRGLKLTNEGMSFKLATTNLLNEWTAIPDKVKGMNIHAPTRLGSFEVFTTYFLKKVVDFVELDTLEIHELMPGHLENALANGQVDIGITYAPIPKAGVEFTEIIKIQMGVFGFNKYQKLDFSSLPFVIPLKPAQGIPSKVMGLDGWPDHKYPRNVKFRVTMMESALELCRMGKAVAYLPKFIVDLHNANLRAEFKLHEVSHPLPKNKTLQSVYLIKKSGHKESKLERQLAKAIRSLDA